MVNPLNSLHKIGDRSVVTSRQDNGEINVVPLTDLEITSTANVQELKRIIASKLSEAENSEQNWQELINKHGADSEEVKSKAIVYIEKEISYKIPEDVLKVLEPKDFLPALNLQSDKDESRSTLPDNVREILVSKTINHGSEDDLRNFIRYFIYNYYETVPEALAKAYSSNNELVSDNPRFVLRSGQAISPELLQSSAFVGVHGFRSVCEDIANDSDEPNFNGIEKTFAAFKLKDQDRYLEHLISKPLTPSGGWRNKPDLALTVAWNGFKTGKKPEELKDWAKKILLLDSPHAALANDAAITETFTENDLEELASQAKHDTRTLYTVLSNGLDAKNPKLQAYAKKLFLAGFPSIDHSNLSEIEFTSDEISKMQDEYLASWASLENYAGPRVGGSDPDSRVKLPRLKTIFAILASQSGLEDEFFREQVLSPILNDSDRRSRLFLEADFDPEFKTWGLLTDDALASFDLEAFINLVDSTEAKASKDGDRLVAKRLLMEAELDGDKQKQLDAITSHFIKEGDIELLPQSVWQKLNLSEKVSALLAIKLGVKIPSDIEFDVFTLVAKDQDLKRELLSRVEEPAVESLVKDIGDILAGHQRGDYSRLTRSQIIGFDEFQEALRRAGAL